jgi:dTDP-4-amino-4,6-dideoxygalactose transaminase
MIKWWNLKLGNKEKKSINQIFLYKSFSLGPVTQKLEKELEKFLKVKNVIAVNSGSNGMLLSLLSLDLKANDEIIIPNVGWISLLNAIKILNLKPILVDVEENKPLIDIDKIQKKITKKTKVIIPVHMNGRISDMNKLLYLAKKKNIYIIEDAAQAFGVKFKKKYLGTFGDIGVFSMSMTKALCAGQGGFLVVNNGILAKKLKIMRNQGAVNVFKISVWKNFGFNFKITDMQSAIALSQLKKIKKYIRKMKNNFILYENLLKNFSNYIFPAFLDHKKGESPLYNEFICKNRRHLMNYLKTNNIETREFYPNFDKVKYMKIQKGKFPNSRIYQNSSLYLPSGPNLKLEEIKRTTKFIKNFYS